MALVIAVAVVLDSIFPDLYWVSTSNLNNALQKHCDAPPRAQEKPMLHAGQTRSANLAGKYVRLPTTGSLTSD